MNLGGGDRPATLPFLVPAHAHKSPPLQTPIHSRQMPCKLSFFILFITFVTNWCCRLRAVRHRRAAAKLPLTSRYRAAATAAASALLTPVRRRRCRALRCHHRRRATAKLRPTSCCCADAILAESALLQPRCRRRAVHHRRALRCRHRRALTKLLPLPRCAPPPS